MIYTKEEMECLEQSARERENLVLKVDKLKALMLLTDPSVSSVVVGDTQVTQWDEFIKEFPEEA